MPKWAAGATDFTMRVAPNVRAGTKYINVPPPVMEKLGNSKSIRFSLRGVVIVVENAD